MTVKSAYIHIPFCVRICTYCDFNKYFIQNQPVDEYLDALIKEMSTATYKNLRTMYVGGGTPTALSIAQLEKLLIAIQNTFTITGEYTFEANPDELTKDKVQLLEEYGVNRISMGVQTFKPELLSILGRTHNSEDIYNSVSNAKNAGIQSISLDLMYHLPKQSIVDFEQSLNQALAMDIQHISSYGLILEPKTQFYNMYRKGLLKLPNEDLGADMYQLLMSKIEQSSFHQYEISNFALDNHESEHNKVYWLNEEYYGFGAGASGYVDGFRYTNINPVNHYIKAINKETKAILVSNKPTLTERMEEEMFLGLRLNEGVNRQRFKNKFDQSIENVFGQTIEDLKNRQLLIEKSESIALSERGKVIGNEVFEAFLIND
ncbi:TPA: oxygen-independent coproporphyrinogen III oxidase [Staphylococcus argenteus]|uniref:radical SAM family heme chaperone HemW n=1 Tax=Staphylococcus argenteus TaxID=985002 RepID=UPI000923F2D4|nr:radical SAM family heme chaperone HemW [Staphylococcus argenteus]URL17277.1 radical SAM family heme chaperone HemW [Staphylococcus argenteus]SHD91967.1 putative oxygen-independent coproporphyrinogen III oxidase [Staphylococcus argenteus]HDY9540847.1 oxygen-independent coproporphyrinogen III oxidase [Staphylococcus argenteus]HDY9543951.1 oxygen-independent coproporphyrinogen III oxidase [Staphylococcus argenteus]HDY9576456.1 oxygen-independent coproporphyrinogen III oxidase [Staphylococcus a